MSGDGSLLALSAPQQTITGANLGDPGDNPNQGIVAKNYDRAGAVYLYQYNGTEYNHVQRIVATVVKGCMHFGKAIGVSRSGAMLLASASGYRCMGTESDIAANLPYGFADESCDGDADAFDGLGVIYVFKNSTASDQGGVNGAWEEQQLIRPNTEDDVRGDNFGFILKLSGDEKTIVAGYSSVEDKTLAGLYVIKWNATSLAWETATKLLIQNDDNSIASPRAAAVSANGSIIVATAASRTVVFVSAGDSWVQYNLTKPPGSKSFGYSSASISDDGRRILIGAPGESDLLGAVYVYQLRSTNYWVQANMVVAKDQAEQKRRGKSGPDPEDLQAASPTYFGLTGLTGRRTQ